MIRWTTIFALGACLCWSGGCEYEKRSAGETQEANASQSPDRQDAGVTVRVNGPAELIEAIGPNRTIELAPGKYDLSAVPDRHMKHVRWKKAYDGLEVVLRDVDGLRIVGLGPEPVDVSVPYSYAYVLALVGSSDVELINLRLGHAPEPGYCTGGVLRLVDSNDLRLADCDLYGCGTEGITAEGVSRLTVRDCTIRECTYGIATLTGCSDVHFERTRMVRNACFTPLRIDDCAGVTFDSCIISDNTYAASFGQPEALFVVTSSSKVEFRGGKIVNNRVSRLLDREGTMRLRDVLARDNGPEPADKKPRRPAR